MECVVLLPLPGISWECGHAGLQSLQIFKWGLKEVILTVSVVKSGGKLTEIA